jgi:signal transduction histidine kinase
MSSSIAILRRLCTTMNIAAYTTWLAVLVLMIDTPAAQFRGSPVAAFGCLSGFLAVFIFKELLAHEREGPLAWSLLGLEGALALVTCIFWPNPLSPILTIVFMADCGMALGAAALVVLGLGINLALWGISAYAWQLPGAWRLLLAYAGFQIFATLTAWYARRAEQTSRALRETNAYLLATRSLLEESARDHERLRLARELHDVAGHKLTALKLNLTVLQREQAGRPAVDVAAQLATELLDDIRGVVAQIRQHDGLDMRATLAQLIAPFPPPPRIHLDVGDDARVENVAQADTLMRAVQEAVTNVVRHAGAQNAWIELRRESLSIRLQVRDDGNAELPLREGFGLAGMRERLVQLSGSLQISQNAGGGLALDIHLPLSA